MSDGFYVFYCTYFLKFCSRYPIDIKFGFSDGNTLWQFVLKDCSAESCCVYDYEAISELTKPCRVVVEKIQHDRLSDYEFFDQSTSSSDTYSFEDENEDTVSSDSDLSMVVFVPQSLANPKNHCYINSVLQVFCRIFMHFTEDIHFNSNAEGCLVRSLVDGVRSDSQDSLSCFKQQLARYGL